MALRDLVSRLPLVPYKDLNIVGQDPGDLRLGDDVGLNLSQEVIQTPIGTRLSTGPAIGSYQSRVGSLVQPKDVREFRSYYPYEFIPLANRLADFASNPIEIVDAYAFRLCINLTAVPGDGSALTFNIEVFDPINSTWCGVRKIGNSDKSVVGPFAGNYGYTELFYAFNQYNHALSPKWRINVTHTGATMNFTYGVGGWVII